MTDRVALFMMDYPQRTRLKLLGHARVLSARENPELADQLAPEGLRGKVERLFLIQVISYDWNCPQYITPRFTAAEVEKYAAPLKARIAELEAQLAGK
jgi:predicted pyridoxine 5'-phosphate oxidase superfamily flavin-nucleotide-binding protein